VYKASIDGEVYAATEGSFAVARKRGRQLEFWARCTRPASTARCMGATEGVKQSAKGEDVKQGSGAVIFRRFCTGIEGLAS
jgi:hypothetical protein